MSCDAAIFDLDGVIVDSRAPVRGAINASLVAHGFPARDPAELDRFIGPPVLGAFVELTGEPPDSSAIAACVATYHREYERVYLTQTRLVDGIVAALDAIELPLALATAKQTEFTLPLLSELGLAGLFYPVCAASAPGEPKAGIVARALRGLAAEHAVLVGDTHFDVEAACANGVPVIGVTWGIGDRAGLERAGADVVVDRPGDLPALLGSCPAEIRP